MRILTFTLATVTIAAVFAAPAQKRAASGKYVVGYFVPWGNLPVASLDMSKYTHINYGFGTMLKQSTNPTDIVIDNYYDGPAIRQLVKRGNENNVPILLSVGGWSGSQTFSTVAASPLLRKTWIENAMVFLRQNTLPVTEPVPNGWGMDGIDIEELRAQMDLEFPTKHKLLTAAVRVQPFDGPNGAPMSNVAAFAQYFDFISIMAYDIMGRWSDFTGPNAALFNPPSPGDPFSAQSGVNAWKNAGFPAEKLIVGVPFYGHALTSTVNMNAQSPVTQYAPHTRFAPRGGPSDSNLPNPWCDEGAAYGGSWTWKELRSAILQNNNLVTPVSGWTRYWDDVTKTPWLFRESDKTFITYDDVQSLTHKVDFVKANNLKGVMFWDATMDFNSELLDAVNKVHCTGTSCNPTTTTTTTTSSVSPLPTGICVGIAAWSSSQVYATANTKVTYNGRLWSNRWWTQSETPSGTNWGAWKDLGAC
ncbi:hypothetical protein BGW38_001200 [Lunasporangiospora selenospora]|uniref:GH18 domain-containing protein n=1 Tax=Lunasporangiospora selenospora TaxID=979761 RepID=A0A9P6FVY8_9FUNG|nr:hypothetical protein BGW38_001200 [Lunasporangiospora selenospora]